MVGVVEFVKQVRKEGDKVSWATKKESGVMALTVLIAVIIFATFFTLTDYVVNSIVQYLISVGS
jgi:preprotein translocase subunit SecE